MSSAVFLSRSLVWILLATAAAAWGAEIPPVLTILEQNCVRCHNPRMRSGGLSLASEADFRRGGAHGAVIVARKPAESPLVQMISGSKPKMPMGAKPLSADEVAELNKWITEGAVWPAGVQLDEAKQQWWSLRPLAKPPVPSVSSPWPRTPIDRFILAALEERKLKPSAEADRATLIRRVTYDLHGLPPTWEEIQAFVADSAPNAYEKLVDRLLASPRYGERWGRHWLDVVHYGESHGYDKDKPRRNAWPYRDYVIRSFNKDKPYTRFVEEQLAGDWIWPNDPEGLIATGFIAAGPWDFVGHVELREGTVDKKITRLLDRDDMLMATMSTFVIQGARHLPFRDRHVAVRLLTSHWEKLDTLASSSILSSISASVPEAFELNRRDLRSVAPLLAREAHLVRRVEAVREMENAATAAAKLPWVRVRAGITNAMAGAYDDTARGLRNLRGGDPAMAEPFAKKADELRGQAFKLASSSAIEEESFEAIAQPYLHADPKRLAELLPKKTLPRARVIDARMLSTLDPSGGWESLDPKCGNDDESCFKVRWQKAATARRWQETAYLLQAAVEHKLLSSGTQSVLRALSLAGMGAQAEALAELYGARKELGDRGRRNIDRLLLEHYANSLCRERTQALQEELRDQGELSASNPWIGG